MGGNPVDPLRGFFLTMPMTAIERHERFSELLAKHQSQLLGYILALVMNADDAEDLFQSTALVLWQKFDEFDPSTSFLAWSCRVAYFEASNFLRKKRPVDSPTFTALMDAFASEVAPPDEDDTAARQSALNACVDKLKQQDRAIIDLIYKDGLTVRDVANRLQRPPGGVSNSLLRIRRWLLDCVRRTLRLEGHRA